MKTISEYEKETGLSLPWPYWHDPHNHKYGTVYVMAIGLTPTGKVSRRFLRLARVYKRGANEFISLSEALQKAVEALQLEKLPAGYRWSEPLLLHNFWRTS